MDDRCGPWLLGRTIATGAVAEVRAARRADGGSDGAGVGEPEPVAIKRLHPHAARDPALAALFAAERTLTSLLPPHPALIEAIDIGGDEVGERGGEVRPYLAMPRLDGPDLRARLAQGALERTSWLAIIAAIAAAVAHLHGQGWVHGDLNPSNILLDFTRGAVLCDLGVARRLGDGGPVRGTAAYMAPEQVTGEPWTGAVDVFALGVVIWELASGTRLFARSAPYLSMAAIVETDAPALADRELSGLIAAALARAPSARPTAFELAVALEALVHR